MQKKQTAAAQFKTKFKPYFQGKNSEILSTQLGYFLGNKLYAAVKKNKVSISRLTQYFSNSMDHEGEPFDIYMDIVKRTKNRGSEATENELLSK